MEGRDFGLVERPHPRRANMYVKRASYRVEEQQLTRRSDENHPLQAGRIGRPSEYQAYTAEYVLEVPLRYFQPHDTLISIRACVRKDIHM